MPLYRFFRRALAAQLPRLALSLLALALISPAQAQSGSASQPISKTEAAERAGQQLGGKVLRVQPRERNGRAGYQVKLLLASGLVKQVWVDAQTGRVY